MQIFTEEVFQKDNFLAFYLHSQGLREIRRYTRDRVKTRVRLLKLNYKIIYQSYFNRSFQNTDFIQLVYYSFFFIRLSFRPKIIPKIAKM